MDLGSFIVGLAIAILTFAFIARPLFTHEGVRVTREDRRLFQLLAERDRLLRSLQELEMDYAVGKITADDYEEQRAQYVAQGAAILRALDETGGSVDVDREIDAEIETAVAELRAKEAGDRARFCPACGNAVKLDDQFCTSCGESLATERA